MVDSDISTYCSTLCKIRWVDRAGDVWRVRNGLAAHGFIWRFHTIFTLTWPTLRSRDIRVFIIFPSRALSLRNLVSGYECGRIFSAGIGPGSPSRDAANWLPSRFSQSVERRRRYGWLRMVFSGERLFRAPVWCPWGGWRHARGREHCRGEPGCALSGGYAPESAKAEGSSIVDEPGEG